MKKNEEKKEKSSIDNYKILFMAIIGVLVLIIICVAAFKGCSKENSKNSNNSNEEKIKKIGASEEDIISAYGMSKQDAINIVKEIYNSDNFEFSADINEDSKYVVSVENTITKKVDKYVVDPTVEGKSFYMITE